MSETWDRIEAWLAAHAPAVLASLNPPASDDDIAATEALIGRALPDDVRAAYRRHDGQLSRASRHSLFNGWDWLPLAHVRVYWAEWKSMLDGGELDDMTTDSDGSRVRRGWWNPGWVPVAADGGGWSHCVDLTPGEYGRVGQIVEVVQDWKSRRLVADGFHDYLSTFADELDAGHYTPDGQFGYLARRPHTGRGAGFPGQVP